MECKSKLVLLFIARNILRFILRVVNYGSEILVEWFDGSQGIRFCAPVTVYIKLWARGVIISFFLQQLLVVNENVFFIICIDTL